MKLKIFTIATISAILLTACGSSGNTSLNGTSWELVSIDGQAPVKGSRITLIFEDGQASGNSGCNHYGGEYKVRGNKIEFGGFMSTLMACADAAIGNQEARYLELLGNAQSFEFADGQLQVYGSGNEALTFVPMQ
ncbi:MAG: META domain-containing protein [Anaerolineales bacterium]